MPHFFVVKDEVWRYSITLGCATLLNSIVCRGGDLNVYLAWTMKCDDQPMN